MCARASNYVQVIIVIKILFYHSEINVYYPPIPCEVREEDGKGISDATIIYFVAFGFFRRGWPMVINTHLYSLFPSLPSLPLSSLSLSTLLSPLPSLPPSPSHPHSLDCLRCVVD